MMNKIPFKP